MTRDLSEVWMVDGPLLPLDGHPSTVGTPVGLNRLGPQEFGSADKPLELSSIFFVPKTELRYYKG